MDLISDHIKLDTERSNPTYRNIYPKSERFNIGMPKNWVNGHPWEYYKWLRTEAPVAWQPSGHKLYDGLWVVTRYEDVKQVELNPDVFSSQRGSIHMGVSDKRPKFTDQMVEASLNNLINFDAPHHMELRIQHKEFFIPKYVASLREKVAVKIDRLLDDMEAAGPIVDLVPMFSEQVPLFTLCEMLGVDVEDRPNIVKWMHYLELAQIVSLNPVRAMLINPLFFWRFKKYVQEMFDYGAKVMADRRANPREDMLSMIAHATLNGKPMGQEYLDGSWLLIIFAGNDTSRNSISGTMRLMKEFPDQKQIILEDPSLIPKMSMEALRMVSPVIHMRRTATQDTELNGQTIAKDEKVVLYYGAANRDPDMFENPDVFNILRPNADKHIAFGHGPHKCLGQNIAKMQLELAFTKLFERFPKIGWTGEQKIAPNNFVHAISSLKVNLYGA